MGQPTNNCVRIIDHPLVQQKLTIARDRRTGVEQFRRLVGEIARLMVFEVTRDFPTVDRIVETPLAKHTGKALAAHITLVPILRAGLTLADGILELIPEARVGHLGIYRDHDTCKPVVYYQKLPSDIAASEVIILDPMLATGGSVNEAIAILRQAGALNMRVLCVVAASAGIEAVHRQHPDVSIVTASVDQGLNENSYIVPGLGDAGDRMFGTY